jgi:hypothetical protein
MKKTAPVTLPDWLDADLWREFLAHRKTLKKPMTDYAQSLAFKLLQRMKDAGHDPRDSIEQSIFNGWQGLFEPRAVEIKSAAQTDYERTRDRDAAAIKRAESISKDELRANAAQARERALQIKRDRLTH